MGAQPRIDPASDQLITRRPDNEATRPYTRSMLGVALLLVLAAGICALILWGMRLPPTRPRPRSRYRGPTFMSVDRKLKRKKPPD